MYSLLHSYALESILKKKKRKQTRNCFLSITLRFQGYCSRRCVIIHRIFLISKENINAFITYFTILHSRLWGFFLIHCSAWVFTLNFKTKVTAEQRWNSSKSEQNKTKYRHFILDTGVIPSHIFDFFSCVTSTK